MPKLGIRINLVNGGLSQPSGWQFNSVAEFSEFVIGASAAGLSKLGAADDDNGTKIASYFSIPISNYMIPNPKRIRKGYIEYETDGKLKVTCKAKETASFTVILDKQTADVESATVFFGNRNYAGVNWGFEIENIDGADFAVDYFGVLFVALSRHRSL
jgi:hypothetical protein